MGEIAQGSTRLAVALHGRHPQEFAERSAGLSEVAREARDLLVVRHQLPACHVEYQDPHGQGLYQGLEVRPGALLVAVRPSGRDHERRMSGERDQGFFFVTPELRIAGRARHVEAAHHIAAVPQGCRQVRAHVHRQAEVRMSKRCHQGGEVGDAQRFHNPVESLEYPESLRHLVGGLKLPGSKPVATNSSSCPASSTTVMAASPASVRSRALSATTRGTSWESSSR